jgi:hypothetical protein
MRLGRRRFTYLSSSGKSVCLESMVSKILQVVSRSDTGRGGGTGRGVCQYREGSRTGAGCGLVCSG